MRRLLTLTLAVLVLAFVFTGCGQSPTTSSPDATDQVSQSVETDTALTDTDAQITGTTDVEELAVDDATTSTGYPVSDSYTAYINAKDVVFSKLSDGLANNMDTLAASFTLLAVSMADMVMIPATVFGMGEDAAAAGLSMMSASNVQYSENGNSYTISYVDSEGINYTFSGTYDAATDALSCSSEADGKQTFFSQYCKTSFGYVSQYYFVNEDGTTALYQFAINGEDGTLGISASQTSQPAALTGTESPDFPCTLPEWYSINGSTITGKTSDGADVNFEYTPSEE